MQKRNPKTFNECVLAQLYPNVLGVLVDNKLYTELQSHR